MQVEKQKRIEEQLIKDTSRQNKRQKFVEKEDEKDVFAIHKKAQIESRKDKL